MTELADKTTSSVRDTMQVTQEALDPRVHVARHPWVFVGGSLILGYAVGALYRRGWRINTGVVPYYLPGSMGAAVMPMSGSPSSERRESGVYPFYPELERDKGRGARGQADRISVWSEFEGALHDELGVDVTGVAGEAVRLGRRRRGMGRRRRPATARQRRSTACPDRPGARRAERPPGRGRQT